MKRALLATLPLLALLFFSHFSSVSGDAAQAPAARELPLSALMRELSQDPAFVEAFIDALGKHPAAGGFMGPAQIKRLRELILGKEFEALDRFPGVTVAELCQTVPVAHKLLETPAQAPTTPHVGQITSDGTMDLPQAPKARAFGVEPLGLPTRKPAPATDSLLAPVGYGLTRGDLVDARLAKMAGDSTRLAEILNRLALTPPSSEDAVGYAVTYAGKTIQTAEALMMGFFETGHAVEVADARYFANFGHLLYKGVDVVAPFWLDTRYQVPGQERSLLTPVSHSQHELRVRGPQINADVAFYFGVDGKAEFRPIVERDQPWILGRRAHVYTGPQALEAVRLASAVAKTFATIQAANPDLPFGGYFTLGVCNDATAIIELGMTGKVTLYPVTLDKTYFADASEASVLAQQLPIDGRGKEGSDELADFGRILGALPVEHLSDIPIPGLGADLEAVKKAWEQGTLRRAGTATLFERIARYTVLLVIGVLVVASVPLILLIRFALKRRKRAAA
jgi:hypothetical protein